MNDDTIAISGVGVICSVAASATEFRDALFEGRCGIAPIDSLDLDGFAARVGGQVPDDWFTPCLDDWEREELGRDAQMAVVAAAQATTTCELEQAGYERGRIAIVVGRCQGDVGRDSRARPLQAAADAIGRRLGAAGPRVIIATACAASTNAIGLGMDLLSSGEVDVAIVGGTDDLRMSTYAGFAALQSLSPVPCEPYGRSDGLNLGEGAGFMVLERADALAARGREAMANLLGYGLSADAYHPTAPDPTGRGAVSAITRALDDAGAAVEDLAYVNGHGTGTPTNDRMERKAMRSLFAHRTDAVPISSTKSLVGHTLGASGAIEAIACVLALQDGMVPPSRIDPDGDHDHADEVVEVVTEARPADLTLVATCNYAFGGNNAALVLGRSDSSTNRRTPVDRRVVVTGIGAVGALGAGRVAWGEGMLAGVGAFESVCASGPGEMPTLAAVMPELSASGVAPPRLWRQMDGFSRQAFTAAQHALRDGEYRITRSSADRTGVFLATGTGPGRVGLRFDRSVGADPLRPDVLLFPNTTINAASGHVCTGIGAKGPTTTISVGQVSGLLALEYAASMIRRGRADAVLVVASDEMNETMTRDARDSGLLIDEPPAPFDRSRSGIVLGDGAFALLVEGEDSALTRGALPRLEVMGSATTSANPGLYEFDQSGAAMADAIALACRRSGIEPAQLAAYSSSASGMTDNDEIEAKVLSGLLSPHTAVTAPRGVLGESWSSATLAGALVADLVADSGLVPPIAGLRDPLTTSLNFVTDRAEQVRPGPVLLTANALGGTASASVLAPYGGVR